MFLRVRFWGYFLALVLFWFVGSRTYTYFFDTTTPQLTVRGVQSEGAHAGDVQCVISSSKKGHISIFLDEQPVVDQLSIAAGDRGHAFTIPTKTMADGEHILKAEITDRTYNGTKAAIERPFTVDNMQLQLALLQADEEYKVFQGRTLHVQFQVNKPIKNATITALSQTYDCFPESKNSSIYEAFIPVACEENPNEYLFSVDVKDKVGTLVRLDNKFQVVAFPFKRSTMHVDNEKMEEEKELGKSNRELEELLVKLVHDSPREKLWRGAFYTPIEVQRVSTEFGKIRTTQYKGMYAHKALDVINVPKSVVWSPQDGVVVIKDRFVDLGNTVAIDHGLGVVTMLCHLDSFADIEEGQTVKKGNPVGKIGKTGYANGYHLHWEMRVNNVAVDPMQWTELIF